MIKSILSYLIGFGGVIGIAFFLISLLVACTPTSESIIDNVRSDSTGSAESPPVQVQFEPTSSLASPTSTIQSREPIKMCVQHGTPKELQAYPFDDYPGAILRYLNAGGWVERLESALYTLNVANLPVPVGAADMNGDGLEEVAVSIFDPTSTNFPPSGTLLIFACDQQRYKLEVKEDGQPLYGAPGIRFFQDLDGDGRSELVVSSASCGAHTCFERVQVIGWDGDNYFNRLEGKTDDIPYPTIYLSPTEKAGVIDIVITGSGFGSIGAGPQRNTTTVWSLNQENQFWQVSAFRLEPSNYRIHIMHDAGAAVREGDYQQATMLYNRAISDSTLEDWIDSAREQAWIKAFSRYQLVVLYTMQERDAFVSVIMEEMRNAYPPDSPQHGFYELAGAYREGYQEDGSPSGCDAARDYFDAHPQILDPLGPQNFGYGNPAISIEDICP